MLQDRYLHRRDEKIHYMEILVTNNSNVRIRDAGIHQLKEGQFIEKWSGTLDGDRGTRA